MASISGSVLFKRRKKVLDLAWDSGFTAVLATNPQNVFYLSGYWGEGFLLLDRSDSYLIVPKLEFERALSAVSDVKVVKADRGSMMYEKLAEIARGHDLCVDNPPTEKFSKLGKAVGRVRSMEEVFYRARMVKDEEEINALLKGGAIMDRALSRAAESIKPGVTERFVAGEITSELMKLGADPVVYHSTLSPVIVASGPNSSYPHAEPTDRVMREGDFVVVDIVLRFDGYVVDATRTFHLGKVSEEKAKVYEAVLEAQRRGLKALHPGKTFGEIDEACRSYLKDVGLAQYFVHSTGHGIGLEVHEPPWVGPKRAERVESGMAFTIEPGVYLPGRFGVRIEDSVVMLDRPLILTKYKKSLEEL